MRRIKLGRVHASVAALLVLAGGATSASLASPDPMPAGTRVTLPDGRTVVLPRAWSKMSIADLARIGIHPGMGGHVVDAVTGSRRTVGSSRDLPAGTRLTLQEAGG